VSGNTELSLRLAALKSGSNLPGDLVARFGEWIESGAEEELFRVNPLIWAERHRVDEDAAIELFLHAAHVGVLEIRWGVICPTCAMLITTPGGLRSLGPTSACRLCRVEISAPLDDTVEVTFSLAPIVRRLRYHDETQIDLRRDADLLFFTPSAKRTPFREWLVKSVWKDEVIGARATATFEIEAQPGDWHAVFAPGVHAVGFVIGCLEPDSPSSVTLDLLDGQIIPPEVRVAAGPVRIAVRNLVESPQPTCLMMLGGNTTPHEPPTQFELMPFLSGRRLLTNQTFRELFRAETLGSGGGLLIKNLSVLFTDLQESTALYERVGDLRALDLVRRHFEVLQAEVKRARGAVVKTIGDAVMAVFDRPLGAMSAALAMNRSLAAMTVRGEPLTLKIGVHTGSCVAVQSNHQVDYFGRTVNIASRVQSIAGGGEVVCTGDVWRSEGVQELAQSAGYTPTADEVQLKGIAEHVPVLRLRQQLGP
jgi:class 3 adenylate cyclase